MHTSRRTDRHRHRELRLALIGTGRWGTNIARTLRTIPGCHLVGVETRGWRKLLQSPDLDGVLIATPGSTHAAIALPFIEGGIATFIEKPLTTKLSDALRLERAARRSGALIFVGHVHLYNPAYLAAKNLAKRAGPIRYIVAEGMNNGPFRDDLSALWDWAPHDVALCVDLLRSVPRAVRAWSVRTLRPRTHLDDFAVVECAFPKNIHSFLMESWLMPEKRKRLTIVGTRDTVVFDDTAEQKVTLFAGMGPRVRGKAVERREPRISYPTYASDPPLQIELKEFLASIRSSRKHLTNLTQAVDTIRVLEAAERSIERGGLWVRPFPVGDRAAGTRGGPPRGLHGPVPH